MQQKVSSFYISPWSLNDPLCQSQSISYINQLIKEDYHFALITLESNYWNLSPQEVKQTKTLLATNNVFWYPVKWQSGNSIFDKIFSILSVISTGIKICLKHKPKIIHTRSSLPTFLGVSLAKMFGLTYLYDADSILSEEYVNTQHLDRNSLGFKLLAKSEAVARQKATQIIVLTEKLKEDYLNKYNVEKPIEVIPCCVDIEKFKFNNNYRRKKRNELNLTDEQLFIYVGKYGSWYLVEETIDFFKIVLENDSSAKLLIVTKDKSEVFTNLFNAKNISASSYFIKSAEPTEVTQWLSASDVGLAFIKPLPSKRGSSPIKTSEYLANGLPIISNLGIGDLDGIIENEQVGAVLQKFDETEYIKALEIVNNLRKTDNLREKCRQVADRHFNLVTVGGFRYRNLYQTLLKK